LRLRKVVTLSLATLTTAGSVAFAVTPSNAATVTPDRNGAGRPAASSALPSEASPPIDAAKLAWLSPEQHAALMAQQTHAGNAVPKVTGIPFQGAVVHLKDPPQNPYYVIYNYSDLRGTYTPVRRGNADFGYNHYAAPHNLYNPNAIHAAFQTHKPDVDHGAHLEYTSLLTDRSNGNVYLTVRVVVQAASRTDDGKYRTPDGTNIGVITAFCVNYNVCPAWVNA
jgi:hypothetical protein